MNEDIKEVKTLAIENKGKYANDMALSLFIDRVSQAITSNGMALKGIEQQLNALQEVNRQELFSDNASSALYLIMQNINSINKNLEEITDNLESITY